LGSQGGISIFSLRGTTALGGGMIAAPNSFGGVGVSREEGMKPASSQTKSPQMEEPIPQRWVALGALTDGGETLQQKTNNLYIATNMITGLNED